eukprot:739168-Ditylum_brightwellii.AAC.1
MHQTERHHIPQSRSSPLPSMTCKGQNGSRMLLGHGRQGIMRMRCCKTFKKTLQRSMMKSKRSK